MSASVVLKRSVDAIHPPAEPVELVASDAEREKLASAYGLVAVKDLRATIELHPGARGSLRVEGRVVADVVQTCVVSLVPVEGHVDEQFSVRFVRPEDAPRPEPGEEVVIDADRPDPPEVLGGPTVDVGAVVEEAFVLAIDPYPRASGAVLDSSLAADPESARDTPFAVLERLRNPGTSHR